MKKWIIDNLEILHTFSCSSWAFSLLIFWSSAMSAAVSSSSESESSSSSESSNGSSASKLFALALPGPSNLALLLELDWTEGLEEDGRSLPRIFLSVFSRLASLSLSSNYIFKGYLIIRWKTLTDLCCIYINFIWIFLTSLLKSRKSKSAGSLCPRSLLFSDVCEGLKINFSYYMGDIDWTKNYFSISVNRMTKSQ